jgi:Tol biopolymer transport system component
MVFSSNRRGTQDIYWKAATGGSADQLLYQSGGDKNAVTWSADGRLLVYHVSPPHPDAGYWLLPLQPGNPPQAGNPVLLSRGIPSVEWATGGFSPDGRWFVYSAMEGSVEQVFITDTAGQGRRLQVSTSGGATPRWLRSGKEIVYLAAGGEMMSVPVVPRADGVDIGAPRPLFDTHLSPNDFGFDVSPDGNRFLVETPEADSRHLALTLVTNWTAGLKK